LCTIPCDAEAEAKAERKTRARADFIDKKRMIGLFQWSGLCCVDVALLFQFLVEFSLLLYALSRVNIVFHQYTPAILRSLVSGHPFDSRVSVAVVNPSNQTVPRMWQRRRHTTLPDDMRVQPVSTVRFTLELRRKIRHTVKCLRSAMLLPSRWRLLKRRLGKAN
jgi:hypothetical protein